MTGGGGGWLHNLSPFKKATAARTTIVKMRMNEIQLYALSEKALHDNGPKGYLLKRTSDSGKWQTRYFVLFQNLLFYFENDTTVKPSGIIFLEGSYCDKMVSTASSGSSSSSKHHSQATGSNIQVSFLWFSNKQKLITFHQMLIWMGSETKIKFTLLSHYTLHWNWLKCKKFFVWSGKWVFKTSFYAQLSQPSSSVAFLWTCNYLKKSWWSSITTLNYFSFRSDVVDKSFFPWSMRSRGEQQQQQQPEQANLEVAVPHRKNKPNQSSILLPTIIITVITIVMVTIIITSSNLYLCGQPIEREKQERAHAGPRIMRPKMLMLANNCYLFSAWVPMNDDGGELGTIDCL